MFCDRIEININFKIIHTQINDIKNLDGDKKLDADRVFARGVFRLLWKKSRTVTVLDYYDGIETHPLILNLRHMKYAQPVLYKRMVRGRPL